MPLLTAKVSEEEPQPLLLSNIHVYYVTNRQKTHEVRVSGTRWMAVIILYYLNAVTVSIIILSQIHRVNVSP